MTFLITALLLLLNTQIVPTQAMETTPTPSADQEAEDAFKKDIYYLARINQLERMSLNIETGAFSKALVQANNLADLKNLCLQAKNITNIPLDINRLVRNVSVYLSTKQHGFDNYYNTLANDNDDIDIQSLNLNNNHIESLGALIGCLTTLRSLHLANNQLTSIHENITQLTKLITLDLTGNNDLFIPNELGTKLLALPKLNQPSKDGIRKNMKYFISNT